MSIDNDPENSKEVFTDLDSLIAQMMADETEDAPYITPVNYAKIRPRLTPQLVYYRIRTKKLPTYLCGCGRRVIKVDEADKVFGFVDKEGEKNVKH